LEVPWTGAGLNSSVSFFAQFINGTNNVNALDNCCRSQSFKNAICLYAQDETSSTAIVESAPRTALFVYVDETLIASVGVSGQVDVKLPPSIKSSQKLALVYVQEELIRFGCADWQRACVGLTLRFLILQQR
jgi:hypothetical protein